MGKIAINLEDMAEACGVKIVKVDKDEWGGSYGFSQVLTNKSIYTVCGFKTKRDALKRWFEDEFDSDLGRVLLERYIEIL